MNMINITRKGFLCSGLLLFCSLIAVKATPDAASPAESMRMEATAMLFGKIKTQMNAPRKKKNMTTDIFMFITAKHGQTQATMKAKALKIK